MKILVKNDAVLWAFFVFGTGLSVLSKTAPNACNKDDTFHHQFYCQCDSDAPQTATEAACYLLDAATNTTEAFQAQKNIAELKIRGFYNNLTRIPNEIFTVIDALRLISISNVQSTSIQAGAFQHLNVKHIIIEANEFVDIEPGAFNNLPDLERLEMGSNKITRLRRGSFNVYPGPEIAFFDRNHINSIESETFITMPALKELNLEFNYLKKLEAEMFTGLKDLRRLNLYQNNITSLNNFVFRELPKLEELDLKANKIDFVETNAFSNLENLHILKLTDNRITQLPHDLFRGAPNLLQIHMLNNRLASISWKTLRHLRHLLTKKFALQIRSKYRVFDCNCDLYWIKRIAESESLISDAFKRALNQIVCGFKANNTEYQVSSLSNEDLGCGPENTIDDPLDFTDKLFNKGHEDSGHIQSTVESPSYATLSRDPRIPASTVVTVHGAPSTDSFGVTIAPQLLIVGMALLYSLAAML